MVRIAEVSGGNPFYALEMARTDRHRDPTCPGRFPIWCGSGSPGWTTTRRTRYWPPPAWPSRRWTCSPGPPTTTAERMATLLEEVESRGILEITGNRVGYAHPLLARGVYVDATAARRRRMHRAVADVVDQPELKARHLALATSRNDPEILKALDDAANAARARGAPAAAAELVDLAIKLGGGTPSRRLRSAGPPLPCRGRRSGLRSGRPLDREPAGPARFGHWRSISSRESGSTAGVSRKPPRHSRTRCATPKRTSGCWHRP